MAQEIERKYLVQNSSFIKMSTASHRIIQGYIHSDPRAVVRVRIIDDKAYITIKGKNKGAVRDEWEYEIPISDGHQMLDRLCQGIIIDKTRYIVNYDNHIWEVDLFEHPNKGLAVAEIELETPDEDYSLPPFVGPEVTGNPAYYNSNIASTSH